MTGEDMLAERRAALIVDLSDRAETWRNTAAALPTGLQAKYLALAEFYDDCAEAVGRV